MLCLLTSALPLPAQVNRAVEYRAKANFLGNFPSFIEWPADVWPSAEAPFLVCVFGDFAFGTSLAEVTRGTTVHERRIDIKWIRKKEELDSCQILFVSRSEQKRYSQVLDAVRGRGVLTVGETPEFLDAGGIVSFFMEQETLHFDVNLKEAKKARLRINSRLLTLARRVVSQTETAKS